MNHSDRNDGTLPSNTPHSAPLERRHLDVSYSIDIEDLYGSSIAFVIHSVDRSLFTRLILWIEESNVACCYKVELIGRVCYFIRLLKTRNFQQRGV